MLSCYFPFAKGGRFRIDPGALRRKSATETGQTRGHQCAAPGETLRTEGIKILIARDLAIAHDIRRVGPADASLLNRVAPGVFDGPVRADRLAAFLAQPGHHLIVTIAGDLVVGQCAAVVHRHPDKVAELYIDEVGTARGYRRRGIGRAMISAMLDWGRELGCGEVWVGTQPDNRAAQRLFASFGLHQQSVIFYEGDI